MRSVNDSGADDIVHLARRKLGYKPEHSWRNN